MIKKSTYLVQGMFLFCASTLFAGEALTPIAYGVKSLGMGGVSIATPQGAESGFENPALLSYLEGNEVSVGVTATNHSRSIDNSSIISYDPDDTYTPYLALSYKLNKNFTIGALTSYYESQSALTATGPYFSSTRIKRTRVIIPVSYKLNNFSIGVSAVAEKQKYDLYDTTTGAQDFSSTDYGYMIGLAYQMPKQGITIAANYKSKIDHSYFNINHYFHLSSPSELGVGIHWKIGNTHNSIGADYKRVKSSEIYGASNSLIKSSWFEDQNVYALGYSYDTENWSARVGYRHVSSLYGDDRLDAWFPYVSSSNYTVGGTYNFNKNLSTDVALVYAPYENTLGDGSTVTLDDTSLAVSMNYKF